MPEQPKPNKAEKRENRKAVRQGEKARRRALMEAMRARWAGQDADWFNWMDEAKGAYPGPDGTIFALFGATSKLINRLAEVTGEDRQEILRQVLDPPSPRR